MARHNLKALTDTVRTHHGAIDKQLKGQFLNFAHPARLTSLTNLENLEQALSSDNLEFLHQIFVRSPSLTYERLSKAPSKVTMTLYVGNEVWRNERNQNSVKGV
jgi:hypothetical protein